jgi:zinc metalloprotease ZmpA
MLSTRRLLLGTLGAALATALAACSVESDQPASTPSPAEDPGAAKEVTGTTTGVGVNLPKGSVDRALEAIALVPDRVFADAQHAFLARDVTIDPDGHEHVRFDSTFRGLRVFGGDIVAHLTKDGKLADISQTLEHRIDLDPSKVSLDNAHAVAAAIALAPEVIGAKASAAELIVYARDTAPVLAYEVVVNGSMADGTPSEMHVIVDALDGHMLDTWDGVETATGNSFHSGVVTISTSGVDPSFVLSDPTRGTALYPSRTADLNNLTGGSGTVFGDTDDVWGNGELSDRASVGVDAHYGGALTWDYYKNVHGRSGIGNDGRGALSRVHYGVNYANAFWQDSCFCMTYGDGDATWKPLTSIDIAGHEMSHGVTSRTAKLTYSRESGGLNEANSDIFGTMVEFYANNPSDPPDYLIGEKLYASGTEALRYMDQPSKDGRSADCWFKTVGNLNVHYSSGVGNHFFYLLAEGTSGGSPSKTCASTDGRVATGTGSVQGIGRSSAEKIWYRALTSYMTSNTNYAGARAATLNAAIALFGSGSPEASAVTAAWNAVKVPAK